MDGYISRVPFRKDAEPHTIAVIYDRPSSFRAELSVSPTGSSVQLYVNGKKVWPVSDRYRTGRGES